MVRKIRLLKIVITFLLLVVPSTMAFCQNNKDLKIELLNRSDKTIDKPIHYHLYKVSNTSNVQQEFLLSINNTACENIARNKQTELFFQIYNKNLSKELSKIVLNPNETKEFYLKTSLTKNTKLDTWNCLEIKAESSLNKIISNSVLIKSFTPNPDNVN